MLTSYPDEEAVLSAIVAGAAGYLLKQIRARDLVAALEAVGRGESLLDPAVTEKVLERVRRIATGGQTTSWPMLTAQEQKILLLVAEGKTNKEIAAEVFLSDKTVKNYVSSILSKLNLERCARGRSSTDRCWPRSHAAVVWLDHWHALVARRDDGARTIVDVDRDADPEAEYLVRVARDDDCDRVMILGPDDDRLAFGREYVALYERAGPARGRRGGVLRHATDLIDRLGCSRGRRGSAVG